VSADEQPPLSFFAAVRQDASLRSRVAALGPAPSTAQVAACATDAGFLCTAEEIEAAFRSDWLMRWVHHGGS
jgi:hypothetical protein